jgi:hypothetical protein
MGYSGAGGKLIHKKTRSKKSCDTVPSNKGLGVVGKRLRILLCNRGRARDDQHQNVARLFTILSWGNRRIKMITY